MSIRSIHNLMMPAIHEFSRRLGADLALWCDDNNNTLMFRYENRSPDVVLDCNGGDAFGRLHEIIESHKRLNAKLEFEAWRRHMRGNPARLCRANKPVKGSYRRRMVTAATGKL